MEINTKCIVCGNTILKSMFFIGASELVKCRICKLQFLSPLPDQDALDKIYENYYSSWNLDNSSVAVSTMKKNTFRGFIDKLPPIKLRKTLLDVGCATGEMLEVANSNGYDVYGVEISPRGIVLCKERFGEDKILGKYLECDDYPENFFDVITLSDVIEHISDPPAFLSVLARILKPQGLLMIITPDTSSWTRKILGGYWPHYKPEHLYYFNHSNLSRLCSNYFEPFIAQRAYKTLTISYIAGILQGYSRNMLERILARLLRVLPSCLSAYNFRISAGEMLMIFRKHS